MKKQKIDLVRTSKILGSVWQRGCQKYEAFYEIDKEWGLEDAMTDDLENVLAAFLKPKTCLGKDGKRSFNASPYIFTVKETESILNAIYDYNNKFKEVVLVAEEEKSELKSLIDFNFT